MRISRFAIAVLTLATIAVYAQTPPSPPSPTSPLDRPHLERGNRIFIRSTAGPGPMGKWWQNSETAKKLQLSDNQIAQLDQVFFEHKMKLIMGVSDRIVVLHQGRLLAQGSPDDIRANEEVRSVYLGKGAH